MAIKAVLYARCSKEDRKDEIVQVPETQLHYMRLYAQQQGYEIVKELVERKPGDLPLAKRPVLKQALDSLLYSDVSCLLVLRMDRLCRHLRTYYQIRDMLDLAIVPKWIQTCDNERIDKDTEGEPEFIQTIKTGMGKLERDKTSKRIKEYLGAMPTKGAYRVSPRTGQWLGRPPHVAKGERLIDVVKVRELARIMSESGIASEMGCSRKLVHNILFEKDRAGYTPPLKLKDIVKPLEQKVEPSKPAEEPKPEPEPAKEPEPSKDEPNKAANSENTTTIIGI